MLRIRCPFCTSYAGQLKSLFKHIKVDHKLHSQAVKGNVSYLNVFKKSPYDSMRGERRKGEKERREREEEEEDMEEEEDDEDEREERTPEKKEKEGKKEKEEGKRRREEDREKREKESKVDQNGKEEIVVEIEGGEEEEKEKPKQPALEDPTPVDREGEKEEKEDKEPSLHIRGEKRAWADIEARMPYQCPVPGCGISYRSQVRSPLDRNFVVVLL